jgi:hypothetical protein
MKYEASEVACSRVLAAEIMVSLVGAGFVEAVSEKGERVFYREVADSDARVMVYTSIVDREVRLIGKDAIRVVAKRLGDDGNPVEIVRMTRINRVGEITAITGRMLTRMRGAYRQARDLARNKMPDCRHCGAQEFLSRNKNLVCSAYCWRDQ